MFALIFVLMLAGVALLAIAAYIFSGKLIQLMGSKDILFATLPQPGRFMFLLVGGQFERIIENVTDWEIRRGVFKQTINEKPLGFFEKKFGVTWIGVFGKVKIFPGWQWVEFRQKRDDAGNLLPEWDAVNREADVREFLQQFTFSVPVRDMELAGNDQASANVLVTVLVIDPIKAFFRNKNWVETLTGFLQSIIKDWISDKQLNQARELSRGDEKKSDLGRVVLNANLSYQYMDPESEMMSSGGFKQILGVVVSNVLVQSIEATGRVAQAQSRKREAELLGEAAKTQAALEGEAAIIKAEKEAEALAKLAAAKREFIYQTIVEPCGGPGPHVAEILKAQALTAEGSKITTFVEGGANIVPSVPLNRQ
jgi:hypothetical protein